VGKTGEKRGSLRKILKRPLLGVGEKELGAKNCKKEEDLSEWATDTGEALKYQPEVRRVGT